MSSGFRLVESLGKALLGSGIELVPGVALVAAVGKVAHAVVSDWSASRANASDRRSELLAVAASEPGEFLAAVDSFLEKQDGVSHREREWFRSYLSLIRCSIRGRLRSPEDPTGTTIPHALRLERAADFASFLPARTSPFKHGDRLPGSEAWVLHELLGMGGYGEVWLARNHGLEGAVKLFVDQSVLHSFQREIDLLARLRLESLDPGICRLEDFNTESDPPWLRYEYVPGGDLEGLIRVWHDTNPPTPLQASRVIRHLSASVGHLHQLTPPIVHRDLKPSNVLVYKDSTNGEGRYRYKIADFGIAAEQRIEQETMSGATLAGSASLGYASDELRQGLPADPRDDVYAMGVIWYELIRGSTGNGPPTGRGWTRQLEESGHGWIGEMIVKCVEDSRADRFADARELHDELDKRIRAATDEAKGDSGGKVSPPPRRKRGLLRTALRTAVGAVLFLLWMGVGLAAFGGAGALGDDIGSNELAWSFAIGAAVIYLALSVFIWRRRRRRSRREGS